MKNLVDFYKSAKKAVRGALISLVPVLIVCDNANVSAKATLLACAASLLGVGGTVYQASNEPAS